MQITNSLNSNYRQSFRANAEAPKREYKNQIPKEMVVSSGIFACLNIAQQLLIKNSKKVQSWVKPALADEIVKKGFSKSFLIKDAALGALLGVVIGYFVNQNNKKSATTLKA